MRILTTCFRGAVFAAALSAQDETAVLTGRVRDPAGPGVAQPVNYKGGPIDIGGGSGGILVRPNYALDLNGQSVDPNLPADQRSTARYFNNAAFVQPIASFGDVGRNTMTGANMVNLDATLSRSFRLSERVNLQARGEFFNLMNHPNCSLIGRVVNDPTFGIVQNQLPPRQIQLALKVGF
jgi:hypothetical protein